MGDRTTGLLSPAQERRRHRNGSSADGRRRARNYGEPALQRELTRLALTGVGVEDTIRLISDAIGCEILVLDRDLGVLEHRSANAQGITGEELASLDDLTLTETGIVHRKVVLSGHRTEAAIARLAPTCERTAVIVLVGGRTELAHIDAGAIECSVSALALALTREWATGERETRLTDDLFHLILRRGDGDQGGIHRSAAGLGYNLTGCHVVIAVVPDREIAKGRGPGALRRRVRATVRSVSRAPAAVFEHDGVTLVLVDPAQDGAALARDFSESAALADCRIVFAGPHQGIAGIRTAVGECLHALDVLRLTAGAARVTGFDDLGIWTILGSVKDRQHLLRFRDSVLGPLIAHDAQRQAQLLDTLRALLRTNFHWRRAAESLDVHPNTVGYRISIMGKLTGLDLDGSEDRVKADIALRINDLLAQRTPIS